MVSKPYPNPDNGHICFAWTMNWALYPLTFDDDGNLSDVIIPDTNTDVRISTVWEFPRFC